MKPAGEGPFSSEGRWRPARGPYWVTGTYTVVAGAGFAYTTVGAGAAAGCCTTVFSG